MYTMSHVFPHVCKYTRTCVNKREHTRPQPSSTRSQIGPRRKGDVVIYTQLLLPLTLEGEGLKTSILFPQSRRTKMTDGTWVTKTFH